MHRLLSLFPTYRRLLADLDQSASHAITAQDDTRYWKSRCETAEAERDKAQANADRSLKQIANWQAILNGSPIVPFPDIHVPVHQPAEQSDGEQAQLRPTRKLARDLEQEVRAKSRAAAREKMQRMNDALDQVQAERQQQAS